MNLSVDHSKTRRVSYRPHKEGSMGEALLSVDPEVLIDSVRCLNFDEALLPTLAIDGDYCVDSVRPAVPSVMSRYMAYPNFEPLVGVRVLTWAHDQEFKIHPNNFAIHGFFQWDKFVIGVSGQINLEARYLYPGSQGSWRFFLKCDAEKWFGVADREVIGALINVEEVGGLSRQVSGLVDLIAMKAVRVDPEKEQLVVADGEQGKNLVLRPSAHFMESKKVDPARNFDDKWGIKNPVMEPPWANGVKSHFSSPERPCESESSEPSEPSILDFEWDFGF